MGFGTVVTESKNDAVVFSVIFDLFAKRDYNDKLRLGLSHDATTSKLPYGKTSGTTEGAVSMKPFLIKTITAIVDNTVAAMATVVMIFIK